MGMLVVIAILAGLGIALALFVHALRSEPSSGAHGWLVIVPWLIISGWVLSMLITG